MCMSRIDDLKNDITILEKCIAGIAAEVEALQCSKSPDYSLITKKQKDKAEAQCQLNERRKELELEIYKEKRLPATEEQKRKQLEFNEKNDSYGVSRNSYLKLVDN
jgi:regulator of sirC expression with transglutaminase-like and TPR domain